MNDAFGEGLVWFFTSVPGIGDGMALYAALGLVAWAAAEIAWYLIRTHLPLWRALKQRNELMRDVEAGESIDAIRANFAERFPEIDAAMIESGPGQVAMLSRSWEEYRETIVDVSSRDCLQNTARPDNFFLDLVNEPKRLGWLANIFIAFGLLITFLGIIAALTAATASMQGTDADGMREGLQQLLAITAAKFWASVGGLIGSIMLRFVDHRSKQELSAQLSSLCDYLEHGMAYLPPQRIAIDQLHEAQEQTPAVKDLATRLALTIEESFQRQVAPMVSSLETISRGIDQINGAGSVGIVDAMREHAGAEMEGLASAMSNLGAMMTTLSESMSAQRKVMDENLEQLKAAGATSLQAAEAFERASKEVNTAVDPFLRASSSIEAALDATQTVVADQSKSADEARKQLQSISEQLTATAASAETAWRDYQERFQIVDNSLAEALEALSSASHEHAAHVVKHVGDIDSRLGEGIQRLAAALEPLKEFSDQADDLLTQLQQKTIAVSQ